MMAALKYYNDNLPKLFDHFIQKHGVAFSDDLESFKKKLGISRIAKINGLANLNFPVFTAVRPNAKYLSVSSGKGMQVEEALISTLMEAAETHALEYHYRYDLLGSYESLASQYALVNPEKIHTGFFDIPNILSIDLHWVAGVNLFDNRIVFIPSESIFFEKKSIVSDYFTVTSNGVGAAFSKKYAINHALYELIERHYLAQWQNKLSAKTIESVLVDEVSFLPRVRSVVDYLKSQGLDVFVWDISDPLSDISCFQAALLAKSEFLSNSLFTGSAAHENTETAMLKAVLEAVQARAGYISGSRDDVMPDYYTRNFAQINSESFRYLYHLPKKIRSMKNRVAMTEGETYQFLLNQLKSLGVEEALMVQLSDDPVSVVKIVVPQFSYNFRRM